jgi:hypothetical protein
MCDCKEVIHLCDYGCGQEAKYKFKNGKWCCSSNMHNCLYVKNDFYNKRTKPILIETKELCDYGCGNVAKYSMSNKKLCCSKSYNSCAKNIEKNRIGNSKKKPRLKLIKQKPDICEYANCDQKANFYLESEKKWCCSESRIICFSNVKERRKRKKPELCDYGCGQEAKFYFKTTNKWCCSKNSKECPINFNKRLKPIKIETEELCDYGCGQIARYKFNNGKFCCSKSSSQCIKIKPSLINMGSRGKKSPPMLLIENLDKLCDYGCGQIARYKFNNGKFCCSEFFKQCKTYNKKIREKPEVCDYGCGKEPKYFFNNKWCCSEKYYNCEEYKRRVGKKSTGRIKTEATRNKISKSNTGKKKSDEFKNQMRQLMLNGGSVHASSFIQNPSKPQVELLNRVKKLYPSAILNYPLYRGDGKRNYSLDVAIPELMICFESDGSYWHKDPEKDFIRQKEIEESGWKVIRYCSVDTIQQVPTIDRIKEDIERLL